MQKLNLSEENFIEIFNDVSGRIESISSEEDAKVQIVNRILVDVLGWKYEDIKCENQHENGFSDYILSSNSVRKLVVEAKKIGRLEVELTQKNSSRSLKISGSSLKKCMHGIDQAFSYASPNGLPIAVVTDGLKWIIFKTFYDGENYKDKQAVVFPSFESIKNDFSKFYELLAKECFDDKLFRRIFDDINNRRPLVEYSFEPSISDYEIKIVKPSRIAFDLDRVFSNFFQRLSGNDDDEMIIECFVESHESRIADYSLEKITASALVNLDGGRNSVDGELSKIISENLDAKGTMDDDKSIFIVGPTGSGKTTFLERFFTKTLSNSIRSRCVVVNINCLDATGDDSSIIPWLIENTIGQIEKNIFKSGAATWDDLQGLYHGQYVKRAEGVDKELYLTDKSAFKIKFGEYLDKEVENNREGYLHRLLEDVVNNRKMLPVIVIDNTDEFSIEFKTNVFQFSNSLKRALKSCILFFPVTDKSAWIFSKTDIFSIHQSRSYFLPTPSPKDVFKKRIDYIKSTIDKISSDEERKRYLSDKGLHISISDINGFAKVVEDIFVNHDYTSKTLGELTNFNIRKTLSLSKRVLTSHIIKIESLIKSYVSGNFVTTSFSNFMEALILGNYEVYKFGDSSEICPLFSISADNVCSPLLKLRILALLKAVQNGNKKIEDKHLTVSSIVSYFEAIGGDEYAVEHSLKELSSLNLIEPYDLSVSELSNEQRFAITYKGSTHLNMASKNSVYFYQMALTTPINCEETSFNIRASYKDSGIKFIEKIANIREAFSNYLITEDRKYHPYDFSDKNYLSQDELIKNIGAFCTLKNGDDEPSVTFGETYKSGVVCKGVDAVIDSFDLEFKRGTAFVEGFDDSLEVTSDLLSKHDISDIHDGDSFRCDLHRNSSGLYIGKIYFITNIGDDVITDECTITRYFPHRGYGFCALEHTKSDAFFHRTIFNKIDFEGIKPGLKFKAEIIPSKKSSYQIRRIIG